MGCGGGAKAASAPSPAPVKPAEAADKPVPSASSQAAPQPAAEAKGAEAPPQPGNVPQPEDEALEAQVVDGVELSKADAAKQLSKEAFETGVKKLLDIVIDGYPNALRSTMARRNQLLRKHAGDQEKAAEDIKAQAASLSEEGKSWLLGLVPYVGLPAALLYPTWKSLRRVALLAATFGLDLTTERTRAKILHSFAGVRAVPAAEYAVEMAVQAVWKKFAGPVASMLPVGTLVSKVANVEGAVVDTIGRETFSEDRRAVPEEEYREELDPEPTVSDYAKLAQKGTAAAVYAAWRGGVQAGQIAVDKDRRNEATGQVIDATKAAASTAATLGQGAAQMVKEQGPVAVASGMAMGQQLGQKAMGTVTGKKPAA